MKKAVSIATTFLLPILAHGGTPSLDFRDADVLYESAYRAEKWVRSNLTASNCENSLDSISLPLRSVRIGGIDAVKFKRVGASTSWPLFRLRIAAIERAKSFGIYANSECHRAVRTLVDRVRAVEDSILAFSQGWIENSKKTSRSKLIGGLTQTLVNPQYEKSFDRQVVWKNLRSGDVLLSRGTQNTAAAISRLGMPDSVWAHAMFVYHDGVEFKLIEAESARGVSVKSLERAVFEADGYSRLLLLRFNGASNLAHQAAHAMHEFVKEFQRDHSGKNPEYNFSFEADSKQRLYCTQVIRRGFEIASSGQVMVPIVASSFARANMKFIRALGVRSETVFAPGDLEFDPRLDVVAEWRDPTTLRDAVYFDETFRTMYRWMDDYQFELLPSVASGIATDVLLPVRRSIVGGSLSEVLPTGIAAETLDQLVMAHIISGRIVEWLKTSDFRLKENLGVLPSADDLAVALEELRVEDFKRMKRNLGNPGSFYPESTVFAYFFRPTHMNLVIWEKLMSK